MMCLLFSPYWTPIREMITGCQARALLVPTATARSAGLTRTLEDFTTPHTRAIYYNTPQNPTGTVFSRWEAEEVAAFARKHDLVVIADEAYEDLVYDGRALLDCVAAGHGAAHHFGVYVLENLRHDGMARGICGRPGALHDRVAQAGSVFRQWGFHHDPVGRT